MSGAGLDHPLVREYLHELDAALASLPADQASELSDQIAAHLAEALPPGASDAEVAATLSRLGSPAELAMQASPAATAMTPADLLATLKRRATARIARVRLRTWIATAVVVALAGTGVGYLTVYLTAPGLQQGTTSIWWYPQDSNHEVDTSADNAQQSTVPLRDGQRQGFAVDLYNPTDFTQTVMAPAIGPNIGWDSPGSQNVELGVSVPNWDIDNGGLTRDVRFTLPGSIPPHQERLLRVLWTSDVCEVAGSQVGIDTLYLRVRVGWFTRTETVPLNQGWYLSGPGHSGC